jgi:osmoprotectant transport system permease protein
MTAAARAALVLLAATAACARARDPGRPVVVGSKAFTESVILGDMVMQLAGTAGAAVEHKDQLGGTEVVFRALETGAVDVYPEYTGTLTKEIFRNEVAADRTLEELLAERSLLMSEPLGFDNSYAVAMTEARAAALGIRKISDLAAHPELRIVFSNEVMNRADGWPGLRARYALPQDARGMDHDLAYRALASGGADAMDVYTTDAEIQAYQLRLLKDDRQFFTRYDAVLLYRADLLARRHDAVTAFERLEGSLDNGTMVALNARAKLDHVPEMTVAADFVRTHFGAATENVREHVLHAIAARAAEHGALVGLSLLAAILLAVPLGIVAARRPRIGRVVVGAAGLLQTIPSLALLVLLIPLLGIGSPPAIAALFLYGLLPIVRNTHAGLAAFRSRCASPPRARPARRRPPAPRRAAARDAVHRRGHQDVRGDRRRHGDRRRAGRRGRLRPADPDRHPPGRLRPDPPGRRPGRGDGAGPGGAARRRRAPGRPARPAPAPLTLRSTPATARRRRPRSTAAPDPLRRARRGAAVARPGTPPPPSNTGATAKVRPRTRCDRPTASR